MCCLHTGIIIYLICAPFIWYSKSQSTVESSTFRSEFVAIRICVEMLETIRYKLRMFGIPIEGPCNVFCDNKSVVTNASVPTLKKKHNSSAYHWVREAAAAQILCIAKVHTSDNLEDLLTKPLPGIQLKNLIQKILLWQIVFILQNKYNLGRLVKIRTNYRSNDTFDFRVLSFCFCIISI